MSERTFLLEGTEILTLEQFKNTVKKEGVQYYVSDAPAFGITNHQMERAVEEFGFAGYYKTGDVFLCLDSGTYLKNTFYRIYVDAENTRWEAITNDAFSTTVVIPSDGYTWTYDANIGKYTGLITVEEGFGRNSLASAIVKENSKDIAGIAGLEPIGELGSGKRLKFIAARIPSDEIEIEISFIKVSNENTYFTVSNIGDTSEAIVIDGFEIYPNQFSEISLGKYNYEAVIPVESVYESSDIYVSFDKQSAASGLFGMVDTGNREIKIYATERPEFVARVEKIEIR